MTSRRTEGSEHMNNNPDEEIVIMHVLERRDEERGNGGMEGMTSEGMSKEGWRNEVMRGKRVAV